MLSTSILKYVHAVNLIAVVGVATFPEKVIVSRRVPPSLFIYAFVAVQFTFFVIVLIKTSLTARYCNHNVLLVVLFCWLDQASVISVLPTDE